MTITQNRYDILCKYFELTKHDVSIEDVENAYQKLDSMEYAIFRFDNIADFSFWNVDRKKLNAAFRSPVETFMVRAKASKFEGAAQYALEEKINPNRLKLPFKIEYLIMVLKHDYRARLISIRYSEGKDEGIMSLYKIKNNKYAYNTKDWVTEIINLDEMKHGYSYEPIKEFFNGDYDRLVKERFTQDYLEEVFTSEDYRVIKSFFDPKDC